MVEDLDQRTAAAFALFWNLSRSWLPEPIIRDFDDFIKKNGVPPMNRQWTTPTQEGSYKVTIEGVTFDFDDAHLAPPMGLVASNYARYGANFLSVCSQQACYQGDPQR
jgi:hypothetical protein